MDGQTDATAEMMMQPPKNKQHQQKQQQPQQQQQAASHTPLLAAPTQSKQIESSGPLDRLGLTLMDKQTSHQPSISAAMLLESVVKIS